jgi:hypothetical protein
MEQGFKRRTDFSQAIFPIADVLMRGFKRRPEFSQANIPGR